MPNTNGDSTMMLRASQVAKRLLVLALVATAVSMAGYQLWLSTYVMECWASKENIDRLPSVSKRIGIVSVLHATTTLGLAAMAWPRERIRADNS